MFDPDLYCNTCSESMKLSEETLEEMIIMTENKKRGLRRPLQIALAAAALAVVMCVTAAAANPEAARQLFRSFSVSVLYQSGDTVVFKTETPPEVSVQREGERVMLTVDGEKTDITEALERNGTYKQTFTIESASAGLTVNADLTWEMELKTQDGQTIGYTSEYYEINSPADENPEQALAGGSDFVTYTFTDDESATNAIYLPPEE